MATTSIWKVESRMDHVIDYVMDENKTFELQTVLDYAMNEEKTIEHQYVTCVNCMQQNPYQSMMNTKEMFQDKKKIVCFHGYQSFAEGEVTPVLAHRIGVELAEKLWGNRFEVVVTTHLNTDNIHNHIVLNATSCVDGKRYCNTKRDLALLRQTSDDLCMQYGLSVIRDKQYKSKDRMSYRFEMSLRDKIRNDIDSIVSTCFTPTQFFNTFEFEGYEVKKTEQNIAFKHPTSDRFVRLSSLGAGYQWEDIRNRIMSNEVMPKRVKTIYERKIFDIEPYFKKYEANKLNGLQRRYIHYQFKLGIIPKRNNTRPKYSKELKEAIRHLEELSDETILLCKNNIETVDDLSAYRTGVQTELDTLTNKRQLCYNYIRRCKDETIKDEYKLEAKSYTPRIRELRKQIKHCDGIYKRSIKITEFDLNKQAQKEAKEKTR